MCQLAQVVTAIVVTTQCQKLVEKLNFWLGSVLITSAAIVNRDLKPNPSYRGLLYLVCVLHSYRRSIPAPTPWNPAYTSMMTTTTTTKMKTSLMVQFVICISTEIGLLWSVDLCGRRQKYDTIRYDSVYLTCSKKLMGSQLSPPHGTNKKLKCETKNKTLSMIGPVQSRCREGKRSLRWEGFVE